MKKINILFAITYLTVSIILNGFHVYRFMTNQFNIDLIDGFTILTIIIDISLSLYCYSILHRVFTKFMLGKNFDPNKYDFIDCK